MTILALTRATAKKKMISPFSLTCIYEIYGCVYVCVGGNLYNSSVTAEGLSHL